MRGSLVAFILSVSILAPVRAGAIFCLHSVSSLGQELSSESHFKKSIETLRNIDWNNSDWENLSRIVEPASLRRSDTRLPSSEKLIDWIKFRNITSDANSDQSRFLKLAQLFESEENIRRILNLEDERLPEAAKKEVRDHTGIIDSSSSRVQVLAEFFYFKVLWLHPKPAKAVEYLFRPVEARPKKRRKLSTLWHLYREFTYVFSNASLTLIKDPLSLFITIYNRYEYRLYRHLINSNHVTPALTQDAMTQFAFAKKHARKTDKESVQRIGDLTEKYRRQALKSVISTMNNLRILKDQEPPNHPRGADAGINLIEPSIDQLTRLEEQALKDAARPPKASKDSSVIEARLKTIAYPWFQEAYHQGFHDGRDLWWKDLSKSRQAIHRALHEDLEKKLSTYQNAKESYRNLKNELKEDSPQSIRKEQRQRYKNLSSDRRLALKLAARDYAESLIWARYLAWELQFRLGEKLENAYKKDARLIVEGGRALARTERQWADRHDKGGGADRQLAELIAHNADYRLRTLAQNTRQGLIPQLLSQLGSTGLMMILVRNKSLRRYMPKIILLSASLAFTLWITEPLYTSAPPPPKHLAKLIHSPDLLADPTAYGIELQTRLEVIAQEGFHPHDRTLILDVLDQAEDLDLSPETTQILLTIARDDRFNAWIHNETIPQKEQAKPTLHGQLAWIISVMRQENKTSLERWIQIDKEMNP